MKFLTRKIYSILILLSILLMQSIAFSKDSNISYTKKNISNYFSGVISLNQNYYNEAFKHFKKVKSLENKHLNFNFDFIRTLVLLEKFDYAIAFSKNTWKEDTLFFEVDLLLGLNFFIKKDYLNAEKHFQRLNKISRQNLFFKDFIGNVLLAWSRASTGDREESFQFLAKVPNSYRNIILTQDSFLQCYFKTNKTQESFENLIQNKNYDFSRYNFFLANYLLYENKNIEAKRVIKNSREKYRLNLLIKQTEVFLINNEANKVKNFFNCQNPKDALAEFFYVIANLYASEKDYQLSNFYLKISLFLNSKFLTNKALMAENLYYQNQIESSKKEYFSLKTIGSIYSWYASKSIATILLDQKGKKYSIKSLEKEFNSIPNPDFKHYYDLANFYKENDFHKESVKYYSIALKKIKKNHILVSKILDRRGTSYERLGDWKKAEKDLIESLKILPDQAHVLNYLAYTWIDKGINIDKGLEMLKKANKIRENDGYIIDSLGWAYYAKKNYKEAEFYLQKAVTLMPSDPIINDHYADTLWMLNKSMQARYFWNNILKLSGAEQELKNAINKKLIFGITTKL